MKKGRSTGKPDKAEAAFPWYKVSVAGSDDCWNWNGSLNVWGYGDCLYLGKRMNASRAAFISTHGAIGNGLVVCHRCDNPACCNPSHLFSATQAENLKDCRDKGRQRYKYGKEHHRAGAKMTEEMVLEARRLYAAGVSQSQMARDWGIHSSTISRAVRGEFWGHVK